MSDAVDAMDQELADALASDWNPGSEERTNRIVAILATQLATWRSRAAYWRGRCEGMTESVEYLKDRVKTLEEATT